MLPSNPVRETTAVTEVSVQRPAGSEHTDVAVLDAGASRHLFRPEVLAERQTQWLGTVQLASRSSHRYFTVFALLTTAAVVALLIYGDFTRKARINGWLVPQQGLARVFAPQPGVVSGLNVREGSEVRQGDPLLTLSAELQSSAVGATQAEIARRLANRRESLIEERSQRNALLAQQQRALNHRIEALRAEQSGIEREISVLHARVGVAERTEALNKKLSEQGFISEMRLQQVESDTLEQRARVAALERNRITIQRERMMLEGELRDLPIKSGTEIATVERSISQLEQETAEAEARREIVIPAPQDGTVTSILAEMGGHAAVSAPLLSIVPAGSRLEAHLYSPSRAIGFVRPGQRVLLRYQAYPYQKFGHHEGVVDSVSRSAVSPGELPQQLTGVTNLAGLGGATPNEPVYRITVKLTNQAITAYGERVPLQAGMQLEADVALETRPLYEWLLDPLYTITGKWQK